MEQELEEKASLDRYTREGLVRAMWGLLGEAYDQVEWEEEEKAEKRCKLWNDFGGFREDSQRQMAEVKAQLDGLKERPAPETTPMPAEKQTRFQDPVAPIAAPAAVATFETMAEAGKMEGLDFGGMDDRRHAAETKRLRCEEAQKGNENKGREGSRGLQVLQEETEEHSMEWTPTPAPNVPRTEKQPTQASGDMPAENEPAFNSPKAQPSPSPGAPNGPKGTIQDRPHTTTHRKGTTPATKANPGPKPAVGYGKLEFSEPKTGWR
ncbi:hypothetical protein BDZ91DRAFT_803306 [Kalaharituber pfeilii]|nr:hypothetical protein BDZ91DRAFT_803306 [Kalaharituber pfeilii]